MNNRIVLLDEYLSQKRLDEEKYIYMLFFLLEDKINKIIQKVKLVENYEGLYSIQQQQLEQLYGELNILTSNIEAKAISKLEIFLLNMLNDGANFAVTNLRAVGIEEEKIKITKNPKNEKERSDSKEYLPYLAATLLLCRNQIREACDTIKGQFALSVLQSLDKVNKQVAEGMLGNMKDLQNAFKDEALKGALVGKVAQNSHRFKIGNYMVNVVTSNGMQLFNHANSLVLVKNDVQIVKHITQGDNRVCDKCKPLNNTLWDLRGNHPTIKSVNQHPGGVRCTLHSKCRCHFVPARNNVTRARKRTSDGS